MLEALLQLAQSQSAALLARATNLDTQALGLVAFDGALAAAVTAANQALGYGWWVPLFGLAVSAVIAASVTAVTRFDIGPNPIDFYARNHTQRDEDALGALLGDLEAAQTTNAAPLRSKEIRLRAALAFLVVTALYSVPFFAV
jgi:hypothetical protein